MKTSILTTGPYVDVVFDGAFVLEEQVDGSYGRIQRVSSPLCFIYN